MKRSQVFVRAQTPSGKWVSADVLDLDEESFRVFVIEQLYRAGLVVGISESYVPGLAITYRTCVEVTSEDE